MIKQLSQISVLSVITSAFDSNFTTVVYVELPMSYTPGWLVGSLYQYWRFPIAIDKNWLYM